MSAHISAIPGIHVFCFLHHLSFVWQGVIPKYGEMLDEMTTGTCVALEVT